MLKINSLARYQKKGAPGEILTEMTLIEDVGIDGDFHAGSPRQISLLSTEIRRWMDASPDKGLCFNRFKENILVDGLKELKVSSLLTTGEAVLRITGAKDRCHDECGLFSKGTPCRLSEGVFFASVEQSGTVQIGDLLFV
jgi:cyclic pyranopterin phosphate synthase